MIFGKTIKIFLIDGDPNGRMSCELSNWTGKAYKIPRIKVKDCSDRDDLNNTGVYLLFGKDEEDRDQVYIGEAESIFKRLNQHIGQKEFWNEAIVFISKDENLNKAHIKYLENRLYEIAKDAKRYKLENVNTPTQSSISEPDRAEMEEFTSNIKMLVNTLGHKVFDKKREVNETGRQKIFYIKVPNGGIEAQGEPTSEGFVVFKGSKSALKLQGSITNTQVAYRDQLISDGILETEKDCYVFLEDIVFNSPSAAASMIFGRSANGLVEWKLKNGMTLKEFEANK